MPVNFRVLCPMLLIFAACVPAKKVTLKEASTPTHPPVSLVTGYALPSKIEAIPLNSDAPKGGIKKTGAILTGNMISALITENDFEKDKKSVSIYEKGLERFSIIDSILKALKQTRYEDPAVLGKGPYAALILFEDDKTSLEKWIIDSSLVMENGKIVNNINLWINTNEEIVYVRVKIFAPATVTNKYGEWIINAEIRRNNQKKGQFVAQAKINELGENIIMINNLFHEGDNPDYEKGKLILTQGKGKGKISFSESYNNQGVEAKKLYDSVYSYNSDRVLVEDDNKLSCKNRTAFDEINLDYKLYDQDGTDVKKLKKFGFSLQLNGDDNRYFYYGMWNGRHSLYGQDKSNPLLIGTQLKTHEYEGVSRTYTVAESYPGVLYKKEFQTVPLSELMGLDLETHEYEWYSMKYNALEGNWYRCNGQMGAWDCSSVQNISVDTSKLNNDPAQRRYVYLNYNGHEVVLNNSFEDGSIVWVNKSNPIFLTFNGTTFIPRSFSFVKTGNYYDTIIGDPLSDLPYTFRIGLIDLRVLGQDASYRLDFNGNLQTSVLIKRLDKVVKPGMEVPVIFTSREGRTYLWDANKNELQNEDGEVVREYIYSLTPDSDETSEYAWDYNENYPITYLLDSEGQYVYLDQAIYLSPFEIDGKRMNQLRYDGHLGGMVNIYNLIRENGQEIDDYIVSKVVNLPDGNYLDVNKQVSYKLKSTRSLRILKSLDADQCAFELDHNISLDDLPVFIAPNIGPLPDIQKITVNEGLFN